MAGNTTPTTAAVRASIGPTTTGTTAPANPLGINLQGPSGGGGQNPYGLGDVGSRILIGSGNLFGQSSDVSFNDALAAFETMGTSGDASSAQTVAQIQQDLLIGGFYPKGARPSLGVVRPQDTSALRSALIGPARAGQDVNDYLDQAVQFGQTSGAPALRPLEATDVNVIQLTDPNAIRTHLETAYKSALGRAPTKAEADAFVSQTTSREQAYQRADFNARESAKLNFLQAQQTAKNAAATAPTTAVGAAGGTAAVTQPGWESASGRTPGSAGDTAVISPDNAHDYGTQFASRYGLSVTSWKRDAQHNAEVGGAPDSDHLTGMAVDIGGSGTDPRAQDRLNALAQWAKANEGPGKLFRYVAWQVPGHYDHVHLSFNGQVTDPSSINALSAASRAASPAAGTPDYQAQRNGFLGALKDVESGGGNYDWGLVSGRGAHGAYQFTPGTWATAARLAGVNVNDHSQQAQDASAAALVDQYYNQFHDWSIVAAAWNGGVGSAQRVLKDPSAASRISDGNMTLATYMQKVMGAFGTHSAFSNDIYGVPLTSETQVTKPDDVADALANAREQHPVEYQAHQLANTYDAFTKLLSGPVNPTQAA